MRDTIPIAAALLRLQRRSTTAPRASSRTIAISILGWQFVNNTKYIVLRNPWGYQEGTLNVDSGPWTSFDQFDGGDVVGTITLPESGVFSLAADTFQQYSGWYGWVS
jgi:hypothetical protein